ncbi:MAG: fumarate hydratase [Acutalibacteraceae bacterium]|nr:fumarate hydratase [Acutalibacteraceae bacterium]
MKEIDVSRISDTVARLCIEANKILPDDIKRAIENAVGCEQNPLGKSVLCDLCENMDAAARLDIPVCQDTGMAVVFLEIGQDIHLTGGDLYDAVNDGVKNGYHDGLLRKSVVSDPLRRVNTDDNTPAVIHTKIVSGDRIRITVAPKGFGSENMSGIKMLTPAHSRQGVIDAVLEIVKRASNNPCPPMVIGVGIGGDFEQCAYLSKLALCRSIDVRNSDDYYCELENELLEKINALDIGPQGFGGNTTALAVNIEYAPTHIAGLPVAVNIGCHVTRHRSEVIE